ncbi:ORF6N domain-containing protein [Pedobacter psychroterrae]|uniref:ORF6N domain-containing protein n=1 Tax=Pedobacter psychroterrae TaxID=2530453 RepID=A0A4R0NH87_9SPHI|nr:ORF6N domain-containing protein [Pedobacter psychroterrae]TCC99959.1 ORF6N domain-containing protein [Pedobacter psychroterrae]
MSDIMSITQETIQNQIFTIRGKQVMLDRDLAVLYGVDTRTLNQAVKRNLDRFPIDFMFQLSDLEFSNLKSQIVISSWGGIRKPPYVFTETGIAMLSAILRSDIAVRASVQIISAFTEMRRFLNNNAEVFLRMGNMEQRQLKLESDTDKRFNEVYSVIQNHDLKPKQGIFYNGQVFDAYTFIADLIRDAKHSIVLIDNYVDDTVLKMFAKRSKNVSLSIYTKKDCILSLDLVKYKAQYGVITVKEFKHAHDRFLILDDDVVYHIGASLKDLGKKWFAFSKMEIGALDILSKLKGV